jgi:hypothetical protein
MKTIQPVTVWYGGQEVQATILGAIAQNDNLVNSATFQYQLLQEISMSGSSYVYTQVVVTNYLTMTGEAYDNWGDNDYAYDWIAEQLNLTITGPYVPPTPPIPPVPTTTSTTTEAPSTTTTSTTTVSSK